MPRLTQTLMRDVPSSAAKESDAKQSDNAGMATTGTTLSSRYSDSAQHHREDAELDALSLCFEPEIKILPALNLNSTRKVVESPVPYFSS